MAIRTYLIAHCVFEPHCFNLFQREYRGAAHDAASAAIMAIAAPVILYGMAII